MEKITTRVELKERLEDVRAVEIEARKGYVEDLANFSDEKIQYSVKLIKEDEDKHIALLDEMVKMLG